MGLLDAPGVSYGDRGREYLEAKRAYALRRFHHDLAVCDTQAVSILALGDSICEGKQSTAFADRWDHICENELRSRNPVTGVTAGPGFVPAALTYTPQADFPVTNSGTGYSNDSANFSAKGIGFRSVVLSAAGWVQLAVSGATSVDVWFYKSTGTRTFSWAIDGGAATNVDASTGTLTDGFKVNIPIPDTGAHTLRITGVSASAVGIDGFYVHNGTETKGVRVYGGGKSSAPSGLFVSQASYLGQQVATIQPSLVDIELGANDYQATTYGATVTAAAFKTNLLSIIATVRSNCTNAPSIVLTPVWTWTPGATPAETGGWAAFVQAMYDAAAADSDICIHDLQQRIWTGTATSTQGQNRALLSSDNIHPSNAGYRYIGKAKAAFYSPL